MSEWQATLEGEWAQLRLPIYAWTRLDAEVFAKNLAKVLGLELLDLKLSKA